MRAYGVPQCGMERCVDEKRGGQPPGSPDVYTCVEAAHVSACLRSPPCIDPTRGSGAGHEPKSVPSELREFCGLRRKEPSRITLA